MKTSSTSMSEPELARTPSALQMDLLLSEASFAKLKRKLRAAAYGSLLSDFLAARRTFFFDTSGPGGVNWHKLFSHFDRDNGGRFRFLELAFCITFLRFP